MLLKADQYQKIKLAQSQKDNDKSQSKSTSSSTIHFLIFPCCFCCDFDSVPIFTLGWNLVAPAICTPVPQHVNMYKKTSNTTTKISHCSLFFYSMMCVNIQCLKQLEYSIISQEHDST